MLGGVAHIDAGIVKPHSPRTRHVAMRGIRESIQTISARGRSLFSPRWNLARTPPCRPTSRGGQHLPQGRAAVRSDASRQFGGWNPSDWSVSGLISILHAFRSIGLVPKPVNSQFPRPWLWPSAASVAQQRGLRVRDLAARPLPRARNAAVSQLCPSSGGDSHQEFDHLWVLRGKIVLASNVCLQIE